MTRFKATFIHILLSVLVIGGFVLMVYYIWYPKPLFAIGKVIEPLKLLVLVDVIIGPLLTFIVFSKTKAKHLLKLDLSIIVLVQIAALVYGIYTIYHGRASIIAFTDGQFHYLVEKHANNQDLTNKELQPQFFSKPKMAYIAKLKTLDIYSSYADLQPLHDYNMILPAALSVANMQAKFKSKQDAINDFVNKYPNDQIVFFTLNKDFAISYIVYSKTQNRIIDELKF